jgi:hypothetical protein
MTWMTTFRSEAMIPDLSDDAKMARIGRLSTLMKARRKVAQELRDLLIPMLNNIENQGGVWSLDGVPELCQQIEELNKAIKDQS